MVVVHELVKTSVDALIVRCWAIPPTLRRRLRYALLHSNCSRAQTLRHQCALVGHVDLERMFENVLTPHFVIMLLDDLRLTGRFDQAETSSMQNAVLTTVDRNGNWKPEGDY